MTLYIERLVFTLAVLKASFLQSGRILIDLGGNGYGIFCNLIVTLRSSLFSRKAAHPVELLLKT